MQDLCRQKNVSKSYNFKTNMQLLLVASALLYLLHLNEAEQDLNVTRLAEKVFLVCGGNYLCSQEIFGLESKDFKSNELFKICPKCDCSKDCFIAGNCCPDVYFESVRFEFIKTSLLDNKDDVESVLGIADCSPGNNINTHSLCAQDYDVEGRIRNPIVTSRITNITYRNIHCANCRGENDIEEWSWGVMCPFQQMNRYRFNYLSDLHDIIKLAKQIDCDVKLQPLRKNNVYFQKYTTSNQIVVSECNVSGTWMDFDRDIYDACASSYENRYGVFKNLFCYMCNPPRAKGKYINACNKTGLWDKQDDKIEKACKNLPGVHSTGIFKNVFCYICNVQSDLVGKKDVTANVDTLFKYPTFEYYIQIHTFHESFLSEAVMGINFNVVPFRHWTALRTYSYLYNTKTLIKRNNEVYNATKIIQHLFSHDEISLCNYDHIPQPFQKYLKQRTCSCDPKCIFDNKCRCCPDVSLTYPTSCVSDHLYPIDSKSSKRYLVTNGCYGKDIMTSIDDEIEELCVNGNDTLSKIIISDWQSDILYKNIYCYLCNRNFIIDHEIKVTTKYTPWTLNIKCDQNIDFVFATSILDQISLALELNCVARMESQGMARQCEEQFYELRSGYPWDTRNTCNETGLWDNYDKDILWACEGLPRDNIATYLGQYRNVYCKFCNTPMLTHSNENFTCNNTVSIGIHGTELVEACAILPAVGFGAYKNIFCSMCESPFQMIFSQTGMPCECLRSDCGTDVIDNIPPMLRDVFVVNVMTYYLPENKPSDDFKIYDYINAKYREIQCYPGKYWNGEKCQSTLKRAIHMKYSVDIVLHGNLVGEISMSGPEFLERIAYRFLNTIELKKIVRLGLSYTSIYSKESCETLQKSANSTLDVFLNVHFYLDAEFDRDFVEKSLLDLYENIPNISVPLINGTWDLSSVRQNQFKTLDLYENMGYSCFRRWLHDSGPFVNSLKVSPVNKLLFCKQLRLTKQECTLSLSRTELVCEKLGFRAGLGEFLILEQSFAVCADDIIPYFNKPLSKAIKVSIELGYLTNICILVSLSCLFITFFTYCLFRKLRSVPGILTMSLVFSIFASQAILTYGVSQLNLGIYCEIIGIFAHYIWLCMFVCTNVCSYHMFSSFKGIYDGNLTNTTNRKTLILYFSYSYVLPLLVVVGNIAVIYIINGVTGYGRGICFLANSTSRIITMIIPACLVCLSNTCFFIRTMFCLRSLPDLRGTRVERNNFVIFVKLFSITGTLWTLQIIESFIPDMSFVTYVTSVLNGLQGMYIFLSYVCNRNVLNLYLSLCCKRNSKPWLTKTSSNQSSSTQDTSLKYRSSLKQIPYITYER